MNYIVYGKKIGDRCYGAINLHEGKVGVGLVYATLIPDCDRAKMYADKLAEMVPGFIFQVRGAGTRKVYYERAGKPEESVGAPGSLLFFSGSGRSFSRKQTPVPGMPRRWMISRRMECGNIAIPRSLRCPATPICGRFQSPTQKGGISAPTTKFGFSGQRLALARESPPAVLPKPKYGAV